MNAIQISNVTIDQTEALFSLNDLHKASGGAYKHRPSFWLRNAQTKELINEINRCANSHIAALETKRGGSDQGTYVCKELVIAYGMWINAAFALKVIHAFLDAQTLISDGLIDDYQKMSIQKVVAERTHRTGESHQTIYTKLHQFAGVPSYHRIKAADFDRVMQFLDSIPDTPAVVVRSEGLSEQQAAAIAALAGIADRQYKLLELVRPVLSQLTSPYTRQMDEAMQQTHRTIRAALQPVFDSPHGQSRAVTQYLIYI